jgi:hypothetical protein
LREFKVGVPCGRPETAQQKLHNGSVLRSLALLLSLCVLLLQMCLVSRGEFVDRPDHAGTSDLGESQETLDIFERNQTSDLNILIFNSTQTTNLFFEPFLKKKKKKPSILKKKATKGHAITYRNYCLPTIDEN